MKNIIIIIWQFAMYFIAGIPLRLIYKPQIKRNYTLQKNKSYILASNHLKKLDPFVITSSMPLRDYIKLIPFRPITTERFMRKLYLKPLLLIFGCISTKKIKGKSVVHKAEKLLEKGETIIIFPSGKLLKKGKKISPGVGFIHLEREIKNSFIIPINIKYNKNQTKINFKKEIRHNKFPKDLQILANRTYELISQP